LGEFSDVGNGVFQDGEAILLALLPVLEFHAQQAAAEHGQALAQFIMQFMGKTAGGVFLILQHLPGDAVELLCLPFHAPDTAADVVDHPFCLANGRPARHRGNGNLGLTIHVCCSCWGIMLEIPSILISPIRRWGVFVLFACLITGSAGAANSALEMQIETYIKGLRSKGTLSANQRTAWVVHDLSTQTKLVSINENVPMQAASMIKPLLALAFFHQVKSGRLAYGPVSRRHMELMIQKSNNASTNWVMRQVGGPAATKKLLAAHYPGLCRHLHLVEYIPADGRTYRNLASASDYAVFLTALWRKQLPHSSEILRLMALEGPDRLVDKANKIPAGTVIYNKTGSTAMCCGDMGILVARDRKGGSHPYLIVTIIDCKSPVRSYSSWISRCSQILGEVSNMTYLTMRQRHALR
jgi:hypothetical protein